MKKAIAALLLVLVPCLLYIYANENWDGPPYKAISNTEHATPINARTKGVKIEAGPRIDYNLLDIQSIDNEVRVAVGTGNVVGHRPIFYKTTDGGSTWTAKSLPFGWHPRFIAFRNRNEGLITTQDVTGCPSACQHKNVVLKTVDGGENWRFMQYADHKGAILQIEFDSQGNTYGLLYLLRSGPDPSMTLVTAKE